MDNDDEHDWSIMDNDGWHQQQRWNLIGLVIIPPIVHHRKSWCPYESTSHWGDLPALLASAQVDDMDHADSHVLHV